MAGCWDDGEKFGCCGGRCDRRVDCGGNDGEKVGVEVICGGEMFERGVENDRLNFAIVGVVSIDDAVVMVFDFSVSCNVLDS